MAFLRSPTLPIHFLRQDNQVESGRYDENYDQFGNFIQDRSKTGFHDHRESEEREQEQRDAEAELLAYGR